MPSRLQCLIPQLTTITHTYTYTHMYMVIVKIVTTKKDTTVCGQKIKMVYEPIYLVLPPLAATATPTVHGTLLIRRWTNSADTSS